MSTTLAVYYGMGYIPGMVTGSQIRMARAALRWSAKELAEKASVSWETIQRMETRGTEPSRFENVAAVQRALEGAGVEFIDRNGGGPGVRGPDE